MYNTDDVVNEVSTKDCFHHILDAAMEYQQSGKNDEAKMLFDIIATCLGIDLKLRLVLDPHLLEWQDEISEGTLKSYEVSEEKRDIASMHAEIDRIFSLFDVMVDDGEFNDKYYRYLLRRQAILEELLQYQDVYVTIVGNNVEKTKLENLSHTLEKLNGRIEEVSLQRHNRHEI